MEASLFIFFFPCWAQKVIDNRTTIARKNSISQTTARISMKPERVQPKERRESECNRRQDEINGTSESSTALTRQNNNNNYNYNNKIRVIIFLNRRRHSLLILDGEGYSWKRRGYDSIQPTKSLGIKKRKRLREARVSREITFEQGGSTMTTVLHHQSRHPLSVAPWSTASKPSQGQSCFAPTMGGVLKLFLQSLDWALYFGTVFGPGR